jgi:hypothetical protein
VALPKPEVEEILVLIRLTPSQQADGSTSLSVSQHAGTPHNLRTHLDGFDVPLTSRPLLLRFCDVSLWEVAMLVERRRCGSVQLALEAPRPIASPATGPPAAGEPYG